MNISQEQKKIIDLLKDKPYLIGHFLGFTKLNELNNEWLRLFLFSKEDITLQAHRGSYKTTVISLFLIIHLILRPYETVIYFRKTNEDVKEITKQVIKMLKSGCVKEIVKKIYNIELVLTTENNGEISTNLFRGVRGQSQIIGLGIGTSITGKHADIVITDDIVNKADRISRAEREKTKNNYYELQNVKNRGGRFINTGTPWHKDDAFKDMPNIVKYDCYSTGLITEEEIEELKQSMTPSLFCANYELRHIASEDIIFGEPKRNADICNIYNGLAHVDSAFYGEDYTAFSVMKKHDGKYYVYGKIWRKNVEECYSSIKADYTRFLIGKLYNETNADKGMVAKEMRKQGMHVITYNESLNKYIKIVTYLKAIWKDVIFVEGTDDEYINQIIDYNENAEHDDAPDSASCLARLLYNKSEQEYKPLFM